MAGISCRWASKHGSWDALSTTAFAASGGGRAAQAADETASATTSDEAKAAPFGEAKAPPSDEAKAAPSSEANIDYSDEAAVAFAVNAAPIAPSRIAAEPLAVPASTAVPLNDLGVIRAAFVPSEGPNTSRSAVISMQSPDAAQPGDVNAAAAVAPEDAAWGTGGTGSIASGGGTGGSVCKAALQRSSEVAAETAAGVRTGAVGCLAHADAGPSEPSGTSVGQRPAVPAAGVAEAAGTGGACTDEAWLTVALPVQREVSAPVNTLDKGVQSRLRCPPSHVRAHTQTHTRAKRDVSPRLGATHGLYRRWHGSLHLMGVLRPRDP